MYARLDQEGWCEGMRDVWHNMYNYTIFSGCFGGHIPVGISSRILDWILLMDNKEHSLVVLLIYMLKICEPKIMRMAESEERFKYISFGGFIIDCFENEAYYNELVGKYLTLHVQSVAGSSIDSSDNYEFLGLEEIHQ